MDVFDLKFRLIYLFLLIKKNVFFLIHVNISYFNFYLFIYLYLCNLKKIFNEFFYIKKCDMTNFPLHNTY